MERVNFAFDSTAPISEQVAQALDAVALARSPPMWVGSSSTALRASRTPAGQTGQLTQCLIIGSMGENLQIV